MAQSHLEMHNDHRQCEREILFWRDDLRAWQHELQKAKSEISILEKALSDHADALRLHASAIRLEEQAVDAHEHSLTCFEKGGSGEELIAMAAEHSGELERHQKHRQDHEQMKRRHHTVLALWSHLLKALTETTSEPSQIGHRISELGKPPCES